MTKKIQIKRFDKNLPIPKYETRGAAGFDLHAREGVIINPGKLAYVPLNVAIKTPKNHFLLLAARSSTHKLGVMPINGIGIGDSDFRGDIDEYCIPLYNFTDKPITIERGTRVAQGIFVKFERTTWKEVSKMTAKTRGGFGTTGKK